MSTTTARLGLTQPATTDAVSELREATGGNASILDNALMFLSGTIANLPAPSTVVPGTAYYATDVAVMFHAVGGTTQASAWINSMFSPGDLKCSAIAAAPTGWLLCNGSGVSSTTYPALYAAIGTAYGGNSTTFNLPDLRGRVPLGAGKGSATAASTWALGAQPTSGAGGEETHTLAATEMPVHAHGVNDPGHNHGGATGGGESGTYDVGGGLGTEVTSSAPAMNRQFAQQSGYITPSWGSVPTSNFIYFTHEHSIPPLGIAVGGTGISIQDAGSGGAHNNVQPVSVVNWFIKT